MFDEEQANCLDSCLSYVLATLRNGEVRCWRAKGLKYRQANFPPLAGPTIGGGTYAEASEL